MPLLFSEAPSQQCLSVSAGEGGFFSRYKMVSPAPIHCKPLLLTAMCIPPCSMPSECTPQSLLLFSCEVSENLKMLHAGSGAHCGRQLHCSLGHDRV